MPDAAHDFPQLRRALCRARTASARAGSSDAWDEARESAAHRAWSRARQSYGTELLEPILGGPWDLTSAVSSNTGRAYPRTIADLPLVTVFARTVGGQAARLLPPRPVAAQRGDHRLHRGVSRVR